MDAQDHLVISTRSRSAAVAASIGNLLEWYDFAVYGYLAGIIATRFFAPGDPVAALLSSFAVFGIGFVARPLGGITIGWLADVKGRRPALLLTIVLMAVGTLLVGISPTYTSIGAAAPAILVFARLLQGFSAGGEWGTATSFLVESAPTGRRGLVGSLQQTTTFMGLLLGSSIAALISTVLTPADMESWGWRIPFILGALIGPFGLYMRRTMAESPAFESAATARSQPKASEWGPSIRLFALVAVPFAVTFTFLSYLPTFTQKYGGLSRTESLWSNSIALVVLVVSIPVCGMLSDKVGRRPLLILANALFLVFSYPLMQATLSYPGFSTVVAVQAAFGVFYGIYAGAAAPAYVELFPTATRLRWLSTSYNVAGIVFGAFAAYIATWLIEKTGSPIAVVYFVIFATIVSGIGMVGMQETAHKPLR